MSSSTTKGRPHTFGKDMENTAKIMEMIVRIKSGDLPSKRHLQQLQDSNLVTFDLGEKQKGQRGRRPFMWRLTESAEQMFKSGLPV